MDEQIRASRKPVKVLVWEGDGPPPGYTCRVVMLQLAMDDARKDLEAGQIEFLRMQVRDLASHENPTRSDTIDMDAVDTFHEMRFKGGALGSKVNVRVFFDVRNFEKVQVIRILGVHWKKNEGQTSRPVKAKIARRQAMWNRGEFPMPKLGTTRGREQAGG